MGENLAGPGTLFEPFSGEFVPGPANKRFSRMIRYPFLDPAEAVSARGRGPPPETAALSPAPGPSHHPKYAQNKLIIRGEIMEKDLLTFWRGSDIIFM